MINRLPFEIWYENPIGRKRRMAAFHMRFMAEKFLESLPKFEQEHMYIVRIDEEQD